MSVLADWKLVYDPQMDAVISALDESDFDAWFAVYEAVFDRDFDAPWSAAEKRVNLTNDAYGTHVALVVSVNDIIVGGGAVSLPLQDNRDLAYVDLFVHPAHRRHGHGSAALAAMADIARKHGRTRLFAEACWGVDETTSPGREFARARGFTSDLLDAIRQLDLPVDIPEAPVADGYTLATWRDVCPEEWVDEYADLRRRMNNEAPNGEVGLEDEHWDAARVRADESDAQRARRTMQVVVARDPSGRLAGHTQLSFPADPPNVFQWDTLVLAEHRGHGLGLSLKAEAMRVSGDLLSDRTRIMTYNAASNAPMIAVNELLGFRQVAWCEELNLAL